MTRAAARGHGPCPVGCCHARRYRKAAAWGEVSPPRPYRLSIVGGRSWVSVGRCSKQECRLLLLL